MIDSIDDSTELLTFHAPDAGLLAAGEGMNTYASTVGVGTPSSTCGA